MKHLVLAVVAAATCTTVGSAGAVPREGDDLFRRQVLFAEPASSLPEIRNDVPLGQPPVLQPRHASGEFDLEKFASRISYAGAILLTADHVFRSVDSVLERAQVRCADGTCIRLDMKSASGVGMMLKVSRPIEF